MTRLSLDQVVADIAREAHTYLDRDDPLVMSAAINSRLLSRAIGDLQTAVKAEADRLSAVSVQHQEKMEQALANSRAAARQDAQLVLRDASAWASGHLQDAAVKAGLQILDQMRHEADRAERASRYASQCMMAAFGIAALGIVGVTVIGAMWMH